MKIRDDLKTVKDPYSGEDYVVVPPIIPDVAVIHGLKGDRFGGVTVLGARNDRLLATAARKTIAVVEALVEPDEVLPGLQEVYVAPLHIDAVVVSSRDRAAEAIVDSDPVFDIRDMKSVVVA